MIKKVTDPLHALAGDRSGGVAIIFALGLIVLCAAAGVAIDYGHALDRRTRLQAATDNAALAAALQNDQASRLAAASNFNANGGADDWIAGITPQVQINANSVTVTATGQSETSLMTVVGLTAVAVTATSTAVYSKIGGRACLLSLGQSDRWGLNMGSSSGLDANCGVYVNNSGSSAVKVGSGFLNSLFMAVAGDWQTSSVFTYTPTPEHVRRPMADPLADLTPPITGGCTYNSIRVQDGDPRLLGPGTYCGGLEISTSDKVVFSPGVYIIKDGAFKLGSASQIEGSGVFFFLTGKSAVINWGSGALSTLTAPTAGPYSGMLFWGSGEQKAPHVFGSHSGSILQGAIYSPDTAVIIGCNGSVGASADWTVWVVRSLEVGSGATLVVKSSYEASATPLPDAIANSMNYVPLVAHLTN